MNKFLLFLVVYLILIPVSAEELYVLGGYNKGLIKQGNIDLHNMNEVLCEGVSCNVRSVSFSQINDNNEILIPTINKAGEMLTPEDAITYYYTTYQHLGIFKDIKSAERYAKKLHIYYKQINK